MTCRELIEFLNDYVDGELPAEVRQKFDHHLGLCSECRKYLATYQATIRISKRAEDEAEAETAQMPERLVQAILQAKR